MNIFDQMTERGHERLCFFQDHHTGVRAIIALHSTKLGNALGGTRRWHYATEADAMYDVLRLSEGMTYKAAAAGLPIGGGKSVILLPRPGHKASEAEARAMGRFVDTMNGVYIAAEDVGVDPQFVDWMAMETEYVMGGLKISHGGDPSPFTAQGVINAMKACIDHLGMPKGFKGLKVAIQGVGHVGYNVAKILHEAGAKLIVSDLEPTRTQRAVKEFGATAVGTDQDLITSCDILAPCAMGGVINAKMVSKLKCRIICGGANNILDDPDEDAVALKNAGILYAPDFVANAGGLIHLAGLYLKMSDEELDQKNADIEATTAQILRDGETMPSTYAAAVEYARRRISSASPSKPEKVHVG